jgi:hypothetical protein
LRECDSGNETGANDDERGGGGGCSERGGGCWVGQPACDDKGRAAGRIHDGAATALQPLLLIVPIADLGACRNIPDARQLLLFLLLLLLLLLLVRQHVNRIIMMALVTDGGHTNVSLFNDNNTTLFTRIAIMVCGEKSFGLEWVLLSV